MSDSILDECALLLGDGEDDRRGRASFHASIIQLQWKNYTACRPFVSTRRRAVRYRGFIGDERQSEQRHRFFYSPWQIFSAVLIQALWRGRRARKNLRVHGSQPGSSSIELCSAAGMQEERTSAQCRRALSPSARFQNAKSKVAKIQAMVRGTRRLRRYREQREGAVVIQSFVRRWRATRAATSNFNGGATFKRNESTQTPSENVEKEGETGDEPRNSTENDTNKILSNPRMSVADMIRILNSMSSTPLFPRDELDAARRTDESPRATIVPDARAGERTWSPDELRGIKYELSNSVGRATVAVSPPRESRMKKKRRPRKKKRKETLEDKMRALSIECIGLLTRMKSVPKFSPEWVLSKLETKLISEELEYLYAESIAKRARV